MILTSSNVFLCTVGVLQLGPCFLEWYQDSFHATLIVNVRLSFSNLQYHLRLMGRSAQIPPPTCFLHTDSQPHHLKSHLISAHLKCAFSYFLTQALWTRKQIGRPAD